MDTDSPVSSFVCDFCFILVRFKSVSAILHFASKNKDRSVRTSKEMQIKVYKNGMKNLKVVRPKEENTPKKKKIHIFTKY
jgi:hypothetical protein